MRFLHVARDKLCAVLRAIGLLGRLQLDGFGSFVLIAPACGIGFENALYFVTNTAKDRELILVRALRLRGIIKPPMITVHLAWEHWTSLIGVPADRNDGLNLISTKKFIQVL